MGEMRDITQNSLPISQIYCVLKEYMVHGRVVPRNKKRHSDCLVCVYGGEAVYAFTTHTITVKEGDILYIARGSTYVYDVVTERYDYIYLDFDFLSDDDQTGLSECFHMKSGKAGFHTLFERMNNLWLLDAPGNYEQCMSDLYQIYAKLIGIGGRHYASAQSRKLSEQAAVYIAHNCTEPDFTIGQVAKTVSCSDVHLRRIFKRDYDISPINYATRVRIEKAKSLLDNTDYGIAQIARMVGYQDEYYFSRIFKKNMGCCPDNYRKK